MTSWRIARSEALTEGERLHTCVEGRFVTAFRLRGVLSAIDSVCHHAGGPMTLGSLTDIEDLGLTVVACPWYLSNNQFCFTIINLKWFL
jgi:nitrite reductase/ring-hydroxylating ferredoxin subunit